MQYGFSQVFVGGGISYKHSSMEIGNSPDSDNTINLSPFLGYRFGKTDVGISLQCQNEDTAYNDDDMFGVGFSIFGDYNFLVIDKFSILGRGSLEFLHITRTMFQLIQKLI